MAILVCCRGPAAAWDEVGGREPSREAAGPEVREPLFRLMLALGDADSLVAWDGAGLRAAVAGHAGKSQLPLQRARGLERRRPLPGEAALWPGLRRGAVWEVAFDGPIDESLPYSFLGYHPGSLRASARLRLLELHLADRVLSWQDGDEVRTAEATEIRVHPILAGYVLLDVDGLVDALLGSRIDDGWVLAFVSARIDQRRIGLAVSVGREGRRLFGEFDFAEDTIVARGRPAAAALSRVVRAVVRREAAELPLPWGEP